MSVDLCFWKSGDGAAEDLYDDAAEGITERFESSERVALFRSDLLRAWPDLGDSLEPLEFDPDLDVQEDLSRFVLITLHSSQGDRISDIVNIAVEHGLIGYDPQTDSAIAGPSAATAL
ncbi:hypothetical protein EDD99_5363 [Streptomyces sp. 846.5]|nr:hypothetical protein [Streptomyces sp. 846.5]TDT97253.1 hypothetical protein EDD99_5363 [Streptomyces sp. 846.5]